MPGLGDLFTGLGGAVGDIFGGIGAAAESRGYEEAAGIAHTNAGIARASTELQGVQANRQIMKTLGGQKADIAAAGFANSGSALDLLRSSTQEGALTKQLITNQGRIEELGFEQEAASYKSMAEASSAQSTGGFLSGALGIAGAIFGL